MKTFLCGLGNSIELGWAISTLIPAYRHKARKYERTIVVDDPVVQYFYDDFATKYISYPNLPSKPDRWLSHGKEPKMPSAFRDKYRDADVWTPSRRVCIDKPKNYRKYGHFRAECQYGIVIHARALTVHGSGKRNWSVKSYVKMLEKLRSVKVCSVGTKAGAYHIPGTEDKRGVDLEELCNILASSKVCVGTSSGVMHLASHCQCPHVVLTYDRGLKILHGRNNSWRYKKGWNPFGTPCSVIDRYGWHPPVEAVVETVWKYI